ncbi:unnamed protein product [Bursaphelenchus okinawaensis]|uniref:RRM domain-containing protein n=1 Tax=Bursaphelenchus okinawaensis TaxID=465554 RepID=A0A811L941_9BILA|nr:unnamed protein product [Bursaphelenchus okinawaensis]CAG9119701.1 unnamed protein product [Bursaphelenchus okinawaensis]
MRLTRRVLFEFLKSSPEQTVYLTHLKWVTGKQSIQNYFSRFGKVQDVNLYYDSKTGLHRGFASVTFAQIEGAKNVIRSCPHVIDGELVGVNNMMPVKEPIKNFKTFRMRLSGLLAARTLVKDKPFFDLFVGNIHWITGKDQISKYFSQFGEVSGAAVPLNPVTGMNRGYGFFSFADKQVQQQVLEGNKKHRIDGREVEIKKRV